MKRASITCLTLLAAMLLAGTVKAESVAQLLPADTQVFIEIDDLAKHRAAMENDPVGAKLLEQQRQAMDNNHVWLAIQAALGMTGDEIIDTYLGKKVVVVGKEPGDNKPAYVLSKINEADGNTAVSSLGLNPSGTAGNFRIFTSDDGEGFFAFGGGWMAMTGWEHADFMKESLAKLGEGKSLAKTAQYKKFAGKLPESRFATLFIRDDGKGEAHALGATSSATKMSFFYRGQSAQFSEVFSKLGEAAAFDFGPLPKNIVAAASLNLFERDPQEDLTQIDQLFAPKNIREDILPKLEAPIIVFLGELDGEQAEPKTEFKVPVLGLAVKMKDKAVANDLSMALNKAFSFGSFALVGAAGSDPVLLEKKEYNGVSYQTADFGAALAVPVQREEVKSLVKPTYGAVGDWFIICSQSKFFEQCVDAKTGDFGDLEPGNALTPIMQGRVNGEMLANHLQSWLDYAETTDLPNFNQVPVAEIREGLAALKSVKSINLQLHRGDGDIVVGQMDVERK